MEDVQLRIMQWQNLAKTFPDMRYPLYNVNIMCTVETSFHPFVPVSRISFNTFVANEGGTRIVLVTDDYSFGGQYKEEYLKEASENFMSKCKLMKMKHNFDNPRHSIREPFDFNK